MSIINKNKASYHCPVRLINYFSELKYSSNELTIFLEDCVHELYKAFCNINLNKEFWNLFKNSDEEHQKLAILALKSGQHRS